MFGYYRYKFFKSSRRGIYDSNSFGRRKEYEIEVSFKYGSGNEKTPSESKNKSYIKDIEFKINIKKRCKFMDLFFSLD